MSNKSDANLFVTLLPIIQLPNWFGSVHGVQDKKSCGELLENSFEKIAK